MGESYEKSYLPTIGADIAVKTTSIKGISVAFSIWDLAGTLQFKEIRTRFYHGAIGAFLVFDVVRPETLINLEEWMKELREHAPSAAESVVVLGNKVDLPRKVTTEEGKAFAATIGSRVPFLETSAITGKNVDLAFEQLGSQIFQIYYPNLVTERQ